MDKNTAKQQIAKLIDKYKRLLEAGKVKTYNEAQTRNEFIEPFFQFLGWDMRNIKDENEVTTEESVSKGRVDLAFKINNIPVMFLEAKALKIDLDEWKWAEQAINYSWNKSVTWAVLTDFEGIKIFNAEIPPKGISDNLFLELSWQNYLDRFDQLYLLSKESFEQGLLSKEAEKWGKLIKRKQVGEKLFEDLTNWRGCLTRQFKKKNELTEEELDEGVQRIIDRLIFIRTAEDRNIEPNVLLALLRGWKSSKKKKSLYKQLVKAFRKFDDGYNSKLFAPHYSEKWEADDKVFVDIIQGLYKTKDGYRYDFSAISADVLGGIYEQYLGYVLKKVRKKSAAEAKRAKRKSQGIFYTPKYIVDFIVTQTLGEVLRKTKRKDIPKIKVLDPACGSGSFLIAAYDKILETLEKQNPQISLFTKFDILNDNIYGIDLDEQAVEIAQLNLLLKVLTQRAKLPTLQHNIRMGNSLVSGNAESLEPYFGEKWQEQKPFNWGEEFKEVFNQDGFDVVIGNPPYIFARGKSFSNQVKKYYYDQYELAEYQLNTYLLFINRSYKLVKDGGYFGFIIPNTWLTIDTFSNLRKFLLEQTGSLQIINIYDRVFQDANVDNCLLIFKKGKRSKVMLGEFREGKLEIVGKFSPNLFSANNYIINISLAKDKNKMMILKKVNKKSKQLDELSTIKSGFVAYETGKGKPPQTDEMKNNRVYHSNKNEGEHWYRYLDGKDVKRYQIDWSGMWVKYGKWLAAPRTPELYINPRILVRQIPSQPPYSINGVFINENMLMNDRNSMIVLYFKTNPLFILAVLNSKLTTFWFTNTFDKFQRKIFPQFKVKELAIFPIPQASKNEQEEVAKKSQQMLNLNKELQATSENTDKWNQLKEKIERLDKKIDNEIYKLYGLTKEEIKIIGL